MLLRIASDLHQEFHRAPDFFALPPLDTDNETTLILAGDIGVVKRMSTIVPFIEHSCQQFKNVIMIAGNHEHYSGKLPTTHKKMNEKLSDLSNFYLLEDQHVTLDGVNFIGSTLWTSLDNNNPLLVLSLTDPFNGLNDFKHIRNGPIHEPWKRKLTPSDTYIMFTKSWKYIMEFVKEHQDEKNVVITHHAPSYQSIPEMFKGDKNNGGYASELSDDILNNPYLLHIHGHIHDSMNYDIGNTKVICNPRGYHNNDLNRDFDPFLIYNV